MANPQHKPHEQDVLLQATRRQFIGYFGTEGQIVDGIPIHERPAQPPKGTVYEQEYTLYQDILEEDGTPIEDQQLQSQRGSAKFLRGRVITGRDALKCASLGDQILYSIAHSFVPQDAEKILATLRLVVIRNAHGIEIGSPLEDNDIPPPDGASPYPVGESPEEMAVADSKAYAEGVQDDLDDDDDDDEDDDDGIAALHRDLKQGVYEDILEPTDDAS